MIAVIAIVAWLLIGAAGFIYWWTRRWDFTSAEIPLMCAVAVEGPFAWVIGWLIHQTHTAPPPKVLARRRHR